MPCAEFEGSRIGLEHTARKSAGRPGDRKAAGDFFMTELYEKIADVDNIIEAWDEIRLGRAEQDSFLRFTADWPSLIYNAHNHLIWHSWRPDPDNNLSFWIREPKLRHITAPPLMDRLVHHAIFRQTLPRFQAYFTRSSYACIKGRGTLKAVEGLQHLMIKTLAKYGTDFYEIDIDIKSYFATINHKVVKYMIAKIIPEEDVAELFFMIIDSFDEGLPIGFLPSQHLANLIGSIIDHFISDILGLDHIRYMDDIRLFAHTKEEARDILIALDCLISGRMHQAVSDKKTSVKHFKGSVSFCGYIVHPRYLRLKPESRKRSVRVMKKKMADYAEGRITAKQLHDTASSISARFDKVIDPVPPVIGDAFVMAGIYSERSMPYLTRPL